MENRQFAKLLGGMLSQEPRHSLEFSSLGGAPDSHSEITAKLPHAVSRGMGQEPL